MDYSAKNLIRAAAAGTAAVTVYTALSRELTVVRYTVRTPKIPAGRKVKILLAADLHSEPSVRRRAELTRRAAAERPDIIALAGDIFDDIRPYEGACEFLEGIAGIAPCFYVTGNHERRIPQVEGVRQAVRDMGITVLDGDAAPFTARGGARLLVAGVEDPWRDFDLQACWRERLRAFEPLRGRSEFKILLSHRPEHARDYARSPFDLVLSGHAHGGQVRVPYLINGLFAPNQGVFPRYAGGMYRYGRVWHCVSRGLAVRRGLPRVFNRPELVVITLAPEEY